MKETTPEVSLLAHLPDPFGVHEPLFLIMENGYGVRRISAQDLSDYGERLVTYDICSLIDSLRGIGVPPPRNMLDLGDALRLLGGSSKDDGGAKRWNYWTALKGHFTSARDGEAFEQIGLSRQHRPVPEEVDRILKEALNAQHNLWTAVSRELKRLGEWERLLTVEWPTQSIFVKRQYNGIKVDSVKWSGKIGQSAKLCLNREETDDEEAKVQRRIQAKGSH